MTLLVGAAASGADAIPGRAGEVLVVANGEDAASLEIAQAYCRARDLPPANLLVLSFGDPVMLKARHFRRKLMDPLLDRWSRLDPHPRYIVLVRGVPYRTGRSSTTAAILFNSLQPQRIPHGYFEEEGAFDPDVPWRGRRLRPATVLSGFSLRDALALIDRSDAHYPAPERAGTFFFCEGQGPRGVRNRQAEAVVAALHEEGAQAEYVDKPELRGQGGMMGYFTGRPKIKLDSNSFAPGGLGGNVTSFGGYLLNVSYQTSILSFITQGACGSYGTVLEPTNSLRRWPHYRLTLDYVRGATVADSYLRNLMDPSLGVVVGDPLCAPFAAPPAISLTVPRAGEDPGRMPPVSLEVAEGREGAGIGRVELWLDDRLALFQWQPELPAGTECRLQVSRPMRKGYQRQFRLEEATPLAEVLRRMRGQENNSVVDVAGRFKNRLAIRVRSPNDSDTPVIASLVLEGPRHSKRYSKEMRPKPLRVAASVFSLGSRPPAAGDAVTVVYDQRKETVKATEGEGMTQFAQRVALALSRLTKARESEPVVQVQTVSAADAQRVNRDLLPGVWVQLVNPHLGFQAELPLSVSIQRSADSEFADGETGPVRLVLTREREAWAVFQPEWAVPTVRRDIAIPAAELQPGTHTLTCIAWGMTEGMRVQRQSFEVGPPARRPKITLSRRRLAPGDDLRVGSHLAGSEAEDLVPVLFLNGRARPDLRWSEGATRISCKPPRVAPGRNRLHVEWVERWTVDDKLLLESVNRRSPEREFFVRRPLDYGVSFTPQSQAAAPDAEVTLEGPYLHSGVKLGIRGRQLPLRRDSHNGAKWHAALGDLPPGEYPLRLVSGEASDYQGVLDKMLTLKPPED